MLHGVFFQRRPINVNGVAKRPPRNRNIFGQCRNLSFLLSRRLQPARLVARIEVRDSRINASVCQGEDIDFSAAKVDDAVAESEQGVVAAAADAVSGMERRSFLPDEDRTGDDALAGMPLQTVNRK